MCVKGGVKFGFADGPSKDGGRVEWVHPSERSAKDGSLFIPRGIWHSYSNFTNEPAIVLYWLMSKYIPHDEERMTVEAMRFDWLRHAK